MPNQNSPPVGNYSNVENSKGQALLNNYSNTSSPGVSNASNTSTPVIRKMNVVRQDAPPTPPPTNAPPQGQRTILQKGLNFMKGFFTRKQGGGRKHKKGKPVGPPQKTKFQKDINLLKAQLGKIVTSSRKNLNRSPVKGVLKNLTKRTSVKKKVGFAENLNEREFKFLNKPINIRGTKSQKRKRPNTMIVGKLPIIQDNGSLLMENMYYTPSSPKEIYKKYSLNDLSGHYLLKAPSELTKEKNITPLFETTEYKTKVKDTSSKLAKLASLVYKGEGIKSRKIMVKSLQEAHKAGLQHAMEEELQSVKTGDRKQKALIIKKYQEQFPKWYNEFYLRFFDKSTLEAPTHVNLYNKEKREKNKLERLVNYHLSIIFFSNPDFIDDIIQTESKDERTKILNSIKQDQMNIINDLEQEIFYTDFYKEIVFNRLRDLFQKQSKKATEDQLELSVSYIEKILQHEIENKYNSFQEKIQKEIIEKAQELIKNYKNYLDFDSNEYTKICDNNFIERRDAINSSELSSEEKNQLIHSAELQIKEMKQDRIEVNLNKYDTRLFLIHFKLIYIKYNEIEYIKLGEQIQKLTADEQKIIKNRPYYAKQLLEYFTLERKIKDLPVHLQNKIRKNPDNTNSIIYQYDLEVRISKLNQEEQNIIRNNPPDLTETLLIGFEEGKKGRKIIESAPNEIQELFYETTNIDKARKIIKDQMYISKRMSETKSVFTPGEFEINKEKNWNEKDWKDKEWGKFFNKILFDENDIVCRGLLLCIDLISVKFGFPPWTYLGLSGYPIFRLTFIFKILRLSYIRSKQKVPQKLTDFLYSLLKLGGVPMNELSNDLKSIKEFVSGSSKLTFKELFKEWERRHRSNRLRVIQT